MIDPCRPSSLIACVALLGSCFACTAEIDEDPSTLRATPEEIADAQDAGCVEDRQVVWHEGQGPCPQVEGWDSTPVFDDAPGELANYCYYVWTDEGQPDLEALELEGLPHASDCDVVFPQTTDPLSDTVVGTMQMVFHDAINRASAFDLDLAVNEALRAPVSVAVVDTIPDPAPLAPRSEHGESMAAFVRDIACPDEGASCAVDVANVLGMPRIENRQLDTVHGGFYGSQIDLARAIYRAVTDAPAGDRLVISLSLGWEPDFFGDGTMGMLPVETVYAAIEYARCEGAVVIAAAGNQGTTCNVGPLAPGMWEQDAAPTVARCNELGVTSPAPMGSGYSPLVYAVGALDYEDRPISTARVDGIPRIAATGLHAVADVSGPRTPLSGSSVSAALASGTAALMWSFYPNLSADQMMQTIYASGQKLNATAQFLGAGAVGTRVRSLDVCRAMHFARMRPDTVAFSAPMGCLGAPAKEIDELFGLFDDIADSHLDFEFSAAPVTCASGCELSDAYIADAAAAAGVAGCPPALDILVPFTTPQPTHPACPSCTLDTGTGKVLASLDAEYSGLPIADLTVTIDDGVRPTNVRLGPVALDPTTITELDLGGVPMPATVRSATISIQFDDPSYPRPNDSALIVE